jgi:hypothetical protein
VDLDAGQFRKGSESTKQTLTPSVAGQQVDRDHEGVIG